MYHMSKCEDCGESEAILTQVSNFNDIKYLCSECYTIKNYPDKDFIKTNNVCEECNKEDISVKQNLIKHSYKICNSCNISKTIFPI